MKSLERLEFVVSLLDKVSAPLDKIQQRVKSFSDKADSGFQQAGQGAAGLVASVWTAHSALNPGNDFMAGLGEVKSLGVAQESLAALEARSIAFAARYNVNAADVVRSSYDIQSAISTLKGDELARFTEASALLAKGTKSDAATITSYVGTMYGIFQQQAEKMGKGEWVDMLAGQTAAAVQIFKTTGPKMADAFSAVGAAGTTMGASLQEQMAILGTLQSTMEGGEAGTKYRAFLKGIGKAQEELGLKFTDSQGKMLPIIQILERIKGKFGDIDTVAESDLMQKAFGSDEAVALVKLLSGNTDGLAASMDRLGKVNGIDQAAAMADAMMTPLDRATGSARALTTQFSTLMNKAMEPFFSKVASGTERMGLWLQMFPNLARWAAFAGIAVLGLVAAVSAFALFGGIATLVSAGWAAGGAALQVVLGGLNLVMGLLKVTTLLFNAALWANPITWVVVGVLLLVAAAALLWFKWDAIKTAFADSKWGKSTIGMLQELGTWLEKAGSFVSSLGLSWDGFLTKISNLSPLEALQGILQAISSPFSLAANMAGSVIGGQVAPIASPVAPTAASIPGGAGKQVANAFSSVNNSGPRIGEMHIHTSDQLTPDKIAHLAQFHA